MKNDYVLIGKDSKQKLIEGVNLITDAIQCTYGPNGSNVGIRTPYGVKVTKDGKTVAEHIKSDDKFVQTGIDLIKEVSQKTAEEVGDGSSTVAILTRALVLEHKDCDNPIMLSRNLREECDRVIDVLQSKRKWIKGEEMLKKVATLSANNDEKIGEVIANAFTIVGEDGLVTFEKSNSVNDRIEFSMGFEIENGFFSPYLINTKEDSVELNNVQVYISDTKMEETKQVYEIWQNAINQGKSLLLMAPDFDSSITMFIYKNMFKPNSTMQAGMVISPAFGHMRETVIEDIKAILGESMTCKKIKMTKDKTTFMGYKSDEKAVKNRINDLKICLKTDLSDIDRDLHRKRLASLTGGFATIYVGGYSDTEIQTRCDLYEDAISATRCALKGGILPGAGHALSEMSKMGGKKVVSVSLGDPNEEIIIGKELEIPHLQNVLQIPELILSYKCASLSPDGIMPEDYFWEVADYKKGIHGDAIDLGIVEPFLVTKATLENAVSAATNILTTDCLIIND